MQKWSLTFRIASIILLMAGFLFVGRRVQAATYEYYDDYTCMVNEDGTLTISGVAADYEGDLVIPEQLGGKTVTTIGDSAFAGCTGLTSVTIPKTVTSIQPYAFARCEALTSVSIPKSVTSIGSGAFSSDISLMKVVIPSGVTAIADYTFSGCTALTNVDIPSGVLSIGSDAFYDCDSLKGIFLPKSVNTIGELAFGNCDKLETIYPIQETITDFGRWAFKDTPWIRNIADDNGFAVVNGILCQYLGGESEITIPDTVAKIEGFAFAYCTSVKDITLSDSVTILDDYALWGCENLQSIHLTDHVTTIGAHCFEQLTCLTRIQIPQNLNKLGESAFAYSGLTSIEFPESMTSIPEKAFNNCKTLEKVTIPVSVVDIADGAFRNCTNLADVYYSGLREQFEHVIVGTVNNTYFLEADIHCLDDPEEPDHSENPDGSENTHTPDDKTPSGNPFMDVKEATYCYDAVMWAVENDVTSGMSETIFAPDGQCTRGQVVTFLWRTVGCPEPRTEENPFTDVGEERFYYRAVLWAYENGITTGTTTTTFAPEDTCTRGQVVTFLWRAVGKPEPATEENPFVDVSSERFCYKPILWAAEHGVTTGKTATIFAPEDTCTRGQVVTFLYRTVKSETDEVMPLLQENINN